MSDNKKLIPADGGHNKINGLKIQHVLCVVINRQTLEILAATLCVFLTVRQLFQVKSNKLIRDHYYA